MRVVPNPSKSPARATGLSPPIRRLRLGAGSSPGVTEEERSRLGDRSCRPRDPPRRRSHGGENFRSRWAVKDAPIGRRETPVFRRAIGAPPQAGCAP